MNIFKKKPEKKEDKDIKSVKEAMDHTKILVREYMIPGIREMLHHELGIIHGLNEALIQQRNMQTGKDMALFQELKMTANGT